MPNAGAAIVPTLVKFAKCTCLSNSGTADALETDRSPSHVSGSHVLHYHNIGGLFNVPSRIALLPQNLIAWKIISRAQDY